MRPLLVLALVTASACTPFSGDSSSPGGDGGTPGEGGSSGGSSSSGSSGSSSGGTASGCESVPATIAEEFSAPAFAVDWQHQAAGATAEVDTSTFLSGPKSMRITKVSTAATAAFAYLQKVATVPARQVCVDFGVIVDSFGTSRDDNELTLLSFVLDAPGSGLKDYTVSLTLDGGGGAALVEHANGEQGQPDLVNQRHAIVGSTFWATATWTNLAVRLSLDKKAVQVRAGGNEILRANVSPPDAATGITLKVGVVSETNPAGSWTLHHDNVYVRVAP